MKNKWIGLMFFLCLSTITYSQQTITWENLANISYTDKYFPEYKETYMYPTFSKEMKALQGKKVSIKGYLLDVDPLQKIHVLSKGPMAACYFCGSGGPETAIELHFANKPSFKTDDIITITGTLFLNADDVEHFNYILKDCVGNITKNP